MESPRSCLLVSGGVWPLGDKRLEQEERLSICSLFPHCGVPRGWWQPSAEATAPMVTLHHPPGFQEVPSPVPWGLGGPC